MRFYTHQHQYYCGIDLHTRVMYVCITDAVGTTLVHKNMRTDPEALGRVLEPYREDLAVAVECVFVWYWIADLCARLGVTFVLGHALYMKAIHGGKVKNDRIDSEKIAHLLRGGMLPQAYVYPREMRSTRDLLRRRLYLVRKHAEILGHIQNTRHQYNMPAFEKRIDRACNREDVAERFDDPMVSASIEVDTQLLDSLHEQIRFIEGRITAQAREHDHGRMAEQAAARPTRRGGSSIAAHHSRHRQDLGADHPLRNRRHLAISQGWELHLLRALGEVRA